ncbi:ROK family transcriptional regulator [Marinomonas pollencensis]|uniref:Putative NBD/HSP70 family sugar kinase n=1 Tax=Marinomonas pollencensis TaxID=491954 RepID=A0A3E0DU84_9GAMM|nr:ROK family transcriptional regulator [Marinomonas pollencensis]REG86468.1 putative NBD/HSP70 family sugar kinase [Marinomonas pollencensis]
MKSSGSTSEQSRIYNERIILQLVRQKPGLSRGYIAQQTGLSAQTISVITGSLLERGLVKVDGKVRGRRGQPSVQLSLNHQGAYGLGINVDRDRISAVLLDFSGHCVLSLEKQVSFPTEQTAKEIALALIADVKARLQEDWVKVQGVGLAKPDYMDAWLDSLVTDAVQRTDLEGLQAELTYWQSDAFESWLSEQTGLPCYKENDAIAAATSELLFGAKTPRKHFFYLFVSIACGGSIVADGECYSGAHGKAGSFGLLPTATGKHGRWILEALSISSLKRFFAGHDLPWPTVAAQWQHPKCQQLVDQWCQEVAFEIQPALSAVIALYDPEAIVIGGRLPSSVLPQLIDAVQTCLAQQSVLPVPDIGPAYADETAVTLGAAVLPLYETFAPQRELLLLASSQTLKP